MSFRYQLSDARADAGIKAVSGVCNDSDQFRNQINQVIRQLLKRGGWFGTELLVRFCVYSCEITLPRYVGAVIGAKTCANGQTDIKNNWFSILGTNYGGDIFTPDQTLIDNGTAPCFNEISGTTGKKIAYHVTKNADIGKSITIYGTAYGGQPLQERDASGNWRMGVTLTAFSAGGAVLPAMTTQLVTKITSITREATQGMCYLYEYGADSTGADNLRNLAAYEPNETNPQYRRLKIAGYCGALKNQDSYGRSYATLDCMVKLDYFPLINENDFLIIDDFDALKFGVQALKKDEASDASGSEIFWDKAIRELNYADRSKSPGNQISVKVRTMGSNRIIQNPT